MGESGTNLSSGVSGARLEIESEPNPIKRRRFHFWEQNGFIATSYIHQYIWVPEPYQAMYLPLRPTVQVPEDGTETNVPTDGETLFRYITVFHRKAYRGK